MSRREGHGPSHIRRTVPEGNDRDDRQPSAHLIRYSDQPPQPPAPHTRSDHSQYAHYNPPPRPSQRMSYPPETPRTDTRHAAPLQRHLELSRPHEQSFVYTRQAEFYPETGVPPAHQPAPRQRTAVACRYCRRRKIRCSGYQSSPDGRCTNCVQRDQKCEFLPVSAAPYEAPRSEQPYMTPPQTTPQPQLGSQRPQQPYGIQPPAAPPYHLSPYASPHQPQRLVGRSSDVELLSPPRKRQAVDPMASGRPSLAPIQTGRVLGRRTTSHEPRSGYQEARLSTPHSAPSDYGQQSPPYTAAPSPPRRRTSLYSTAMSQPPPSALLSSRSDTSPYSLLPPPPPPRSPSRATPVTRRYSYQPHTPYSPEQVYSRPMSQGRPHIPSPISVSHTLPPPPLSLSRTSPTVHYTSGGPRPEYSERPSMSPQYDYGDRPSLPPLAHLNRETPPTQNIPPAMPSPIPVSLPPPSGMITAPRNPSDSAILSVFDDPSRTVTKRKRTPSPDPARPL